MLISSAMSFLYFIYIVTGIKNKIAKGKKYIVTRQAFHIMLLARIDVKFSKQY